MCSLWIPVLVLVECELLGPLEIIMAVVFIVDPYLGVCMLQDPLDVMMLYMFIVDPCLGAGGM